MTGGLARRVRSYVDMRQPPAGREVAFLGLGGNMSDRIYYLNRAVRFLDADPEVEIDDISSVYQTEPVGPSEDPFYNVAVRVLTRLSPLRLLRACQQVEDRLGRVRTVRWGPRTIDVDVLLYGDRVITTSTLTVPHPELTGRAFAMVPLLEVATGWQLPDGRSLASVIADLAPIEGVQAIGRQVSLEDLPDGPPEGSQA